MRFQKHLQDSLHDAYEQSAILVCKQITVILIVTSLHKETAFQVEFVSNMNAFIRKTMLSITKSTFVFPFSISLSF